ncbi:MAG: glycoside hydrolase family 3 N-terminal domain-containing protein [Pelobium sp.]
MKNKFLFTALLFASFGFVSEAQTRVPFIQTLQNPNRWVDSVFNKMNRNQKISQLFMVRAHTDLGQRYIDSIAAVIKKEHIGGIVFFQGGPGRQAIATNQYQAVSKVPLMIALDGEWGLGMRLDSTLSYPYQMTLGAIQDKSLIYQMGLEVAKDFKRLGMQINFAPDMDVNNNPRNPVINYRSFGENKYNVAEKGIAYMKGMQDGGIFTTAKHFPGHGDTDVDSHFDLPQLPFTAGRLDSLEMYPFKQAFDAGLSGVMVAHMSIPALDPTPHVPSTLSKPIVTGILKEKLGFKGLIFSDAMGMKGVVKYFPNGEADVRGIIAGMDVIELSENSDRAVKLIRKSIRQKRLSWEDIDEKVKRILQAKYWMGLNDLKPVDPKNIVQDLNRLASQQLVQKLTDASVTVLNYASLFPLQNDFVRKTAILSIGPSGVTPFSEAIKNTNSFLFIVPKDITLVELEKVKNELKKYNQFIMAIHDTRKRPASTLDYNNPLKLFIADMASKNTISVVFANPYTVAGLPGLEKSKALIMGYQDMPEMEKSAAKVILGNLKANGKLPVTINSFFKYGDGAQMK